MTGTLQRRLGSPVLRVASSAHRFLTQSCATERRGLRTLLLGHNSGPVQPLHLLESPPPPNDCGLVVDLADNEDGADNSGSKTLEDDSLVVVDWNLRAIVWELDGVRRWRRIFWLRWRGWRGVNTADRFVDINDVHNERV